MKKNYVFNIHEEGIKKYYFITKELEHYSDNQSAFLYAIGEYIFSLVGDFEYCICLQLTITGYHIHPERYCR